MRLWIEWENEDQTDEGTASWMNITAEQLDKVTNYLESELGKADTVS